MRGSDAVVSEEKRAPAIEESESGATPAARVASREPGVGLASALLGLGGLLGTVGTYALFVGTLWGRTVNLRWTAEALPTSQVTWRVTRQMMTILSPAPLLLLCLALLIMIARTRGARTTGVLALLVTGLLGSAHLLKRLLPRPLDGGPDLPPSFPSGHVALACAVALLVFVLVTGSDMRRGRRGALIATMVIVLASSVGVVRLQWHVPADALGSIFWALCWAGLVRRAVHPRARRRPSTRARSRASTKPTEGSPDPCRATGPG